MSAAEDIQQQYAVIITGGKQYVVREGQVLKIELLNAEDESVVFDKVLMVADKGQQTLGKPYVSGAKVTATIIGHDRHKKIKIVKMRRRKHSRTQMGHRQWYTEVRIDQIKAA